MTSPMPKSAPRESSNSLKILKTPGLRDEITRLGRTLCRWRAQIANWHIARITDATTEASTNDLSPDQYEAAYTATTTDHNQTENHNIQPARNPG